VVKRNNAQRRNRRRVGEKKLLKKEIEKSAS
jgi:hypothetical protein